MYTSYLIIATLCYRLANTNVSLKDLDGFYVVQLNGPIHLISCELRTRVWVDFFMNRFTIYLYTYLVTLCICVHACACCILYYDYLVLIPVYTSDPVSARSRS